ncbi:MAG: valine--tRNA ligase [Deltaproteobacteria bacterium]|jgi:valyl-tRNA synthetase|nr:valine--tRNA ligase [Deltaproteobacteria bacterium]
MPDPAESITKNFRFDEAEARIYGGWERAGLFRADPEAPGEPFVIVIPPPNVTGNLHMGHALDNTLQDMLTRYHRMKGDNTLWMPGTDHAGIATQAVVERQLAKEGISRVELGREGFLERVWRWKEEYGGRIIGQLKRLGASCDWSRERFTMDPGLSRAVRETFCTLYEEGLLYRGDYVTNWCPSCLTAISDIEVEHEDRDDSLYHIVYEGVGGAPSLTVATTRPETLFGDTAVAVHPEDGRFPAGEFKVRVPFTGREIPVIRDPYVEREFGTGALKVTPAHDANDFRLGQRHGLPTVVCIDRRGALTAEAGPYAGLDRFEARKRILADLESRGQLAKTEPLRHAVGVCYRCRTVIEPLLSLQWFVRTAPLAEAASASVRDGRTALVPRSWERTFFDWMDNIRDWCVSRQLWWGHQIPAWYCPGCGRTHVLREDPSACPDCGGRLERDPDVLDTWFSSGLWPFSTLGWPERTPELARYYPTTVLVTGFDIIFFWVARMMMMGLKLMGDVPFRTVVLHPLVRDASGQKMSKSKGNVIDPLTVIDRFGADAFRFALASQAGTARDLKISEDRVAGCSRFVNKLWNAARFALPHLACLAGGGGPPGGGRDCARALLAAPPPPARRLPDRWIRSRLLAVTREAREALEAFAFDRYADLLYHFIWDELCDWYLELAKPPLYGDDPEARREAAANLRLVFCETLALLHPVMPFVTEELYAKIPGASGFLMASAFPEGRDAEGDPAAERSIGVLMDITRAVRTSRADFHVPPGAKVRPKVSSDRPEVAGLVAEYSPLLLKLMGAETLSTALPGEAKPRDAAEQILDWGAVWIPVAGEIDLAAEQARLAKELVELDRDIAQAEAKLRNPGYLAKAPEEVVEETRERLASLRARREGAERSLRLVAGLAEGRG